MAILDNFWGYLQILVFGKFLSFVKTTQITDILREINILTIMEQAICD